MAPVSARKVLSLAVVLTSLASGIARSVLTGVLHGDVLLPCHGAYTGDFRLDCLVINWQRSDSDEVLHSYFNESDQPQYQAEEFKGRTQLFPAEFPKGNASLLLKNLRASDAGHYTCHWILSDKESYAPQQVELLVHGEEESRSEEKNSRLVYLLFSVPVAVMAAAVIFTVLRSKQKRQKRKTPQGVKMATQSRGVGSESKWLPEGSTRFPNRRDGLAASSRRQLSEDLPVICLPFNFHKDEFSVLLLISSGAFDGPSCSTVRVRGSPDRLCLNHFEGVKMATQSRGVGSESKWLPEGSTRFPNRRDGLAASSRRQLSEDLPVICLPFNFHKVTGPS
ncbi:uncharacterized protein [Ambystoma mexicanum]|uniref:uncharacterized protein n=1 Tax=Ambystoma mexicanum TaxID=8296 RepID=UPI0037E70E72